MKRPIYSECVFVVLLTHPTNPTRRIVWSSVACLALRYFSTFSDNLYDFRNNVTEHKIRFVFSLKHLILQNISKIS